MNTQKHTKGKWEPIFERYPEEPIKVYIGVGINTKRDGGTYTEFICNSMLPNDDAEYIKQHDEIEANMKLIAAAPELLEALQFAVKFIKCCPELAKEERRPKGLEKWESVIEKATE